MLEVKEKKSHITIENIFMQIVLPSSEGMVELKFWRGKKVYSLKH